MRFVILLIVSFTNLQIIVFKVKTLLCLNAKVEVNILSLKKDKNNV